MSDKRSYLKKKKNDNTIYERVQLWYVHKSVHSPINTYLLIEQK